jgi:hypothetical protein
VPREPRVSAADLRDAFGIGPGDIELNRQGRLAPTQVRRLHRTALVNAGVALALGLALGAIWFAAVERPILWWQWLLVAVLEGVLLAVAAGWIGKLLAAARDGEVVCHSGPINAYARRGKHLAVDGLTYNVPIPLQRLVQGAAYDVYVVERSAMVVAMVPTPGDPAR